MTSKRSNGSSILWFLVTLIRGLAFFVASYSLLSLVAIGVGNPYNQNTWWIDLSFIPSILPFLLQIVLVFSLYGFAVRIPRRFVTRVFAAIPSVLFAFFSFQNMIAVYGTSFSGLIDLGFPVPFSLFIFVAFVLIAAAILFGAALVPASRRSSRIATVVVMTISVIAVGVLFPLGQILCFGTTEYNSPVDATVVLGAQVMPDGTPSPVLQDRLDKAIELYEQGRTQFLIMSGGIDAGGVSEALAMRDYAIDQGIPASVILLDEYGNNTQLTAEHVTEIVTEYGFDSVNAVSNFYHLARIKMLFIMEGIDITTVPADDTHGGAPAPITFFREIPGWWAYWFSSLMPS